MDSTQIVAAAQMRWIDRAAIERGVSESSLMDRAGHETASAVLELMPDYGRVVIVAGSGNNGGDGYAAACYLRAHRIPVTVVALTPVSQISEVSKQFAKQAREAGAKVRDASSEHRLAVLGRWLSRAVMVVDAMFGTGLARPLQGRFGVAASMINNSDRPVLSIDMPSGICADTGRELGTAIEADYTLPIAASKWGHWLDRGRDCCGKLLEVADIGISGALIRESFSSFDAWEGDGGYQLHSASVINKAILAVSWPERTRLSHKGSYGHVRVFGGSVGFTGAPQLAGNGAYAAGAGLVSIVCPDDVWPVIAASSIDIMVHPESATLADDADVLVIGPGWGKQRQELLSSLLKENRSMVIDADALNMIAADSNLQALLQARSGCTDTLTVLTPHPGEAGRLLGSDSGTVQCDRKRSAVALAVRFGCWVVLKGAETLIASPDRDIYLNPYGSARLAVAGSGDVLAGIIGSQIAQTKRTDSPVHRLPPELLIGSAVALHGRAGARGGWCMASELVSVVADLRLSVEARSVEAAAGKQF